MRRLGPVVALAAVLSFACREQQTVQPPASASPAYLISDGAHSGNAHFFFLPPLAPDPSALFHAGTFNAKLSPFVEVCTLTGDPSGGSSVDCVMSGGKAVLVFGPVPMALDLTNQQYTRNWDTSLPQPLVATNFYRIIVRGAPGGTALGFDDVTPVDQGLKNLRTGDVVQFQDGRTLPIKVRIEQGAFGSTNPDHVETTVRNVATTVTTNTGFGGAAFPDNWIPQRAVDQGITSVTLIIERIPVGPGTSDPSCFQSNQLQREGCYRFRTDPDLHQFGAFNNLVTAGVCFEIPTDIGVPSNQRFGLQRQEEVEGASLVDLPEVPATFLTCDTFGPTQVIGAIQSGGLRGLARAGWRALVHGVGRLVVPQALHAVDLGAGGSTDGFSRFGYARLATMTKLAGTDGNSALAGTAVSPDPTACVTVTHDGVTLIPTEPDTVTFTVIGIGGTVGGAPSAKIALGTDGCAHAPWVLGIPPGPNVLTATGHASGSPLTFTATGLILVRPVSTGVTAFGVTLPFTQTSGLSMADGTGMQLEVSPATVVTWSSSDLTGNKASINTTGLLAVVLGNDDPTTPNGGTITATGAGGIGLIKVNSFAFGHFPRLTTLVWRSVTGAATYDVVVEFGNGCTTGANCTTWTQLFLTTTSNTALAFQFVGAQPGRWHVIPRDASGTPMTPTGFVYFVYTI